MRVRTICLIFSTLAILVGMEATARAEGEYNFSWLDPDKKIYVLQNRKYTKASRLMVSAMVGTGMSNPYMNTLVVDPRIGFYFTEWLGLEAFYNIGFNSGNNTLQALDQATNTLPVRREILNQYGALAHVAPWYSKINVFNAVIYFDWYFTVGAGMMSTQIDTSNTIGTNTYEAQNLFAIYAGTGQQFHITRHLFARLDFLGAFYSAQIFGNSGDNTWFSNYNFNLGLGFRL